MLLSLGTHFSLYVSPSPPPYVLVRLRWRWMAPYVYTRLYTQDLHTVIPIECEVIPCRRSAWLVGVYLLCAVSACLERKTSSQATTLHLTQTRLRVLNICRMHIDCAHEWLIPLAIQVSRPVSPSTDCIRSIVSVIALAVSRPSWRRPLAFFSIQVRCSPPQKKKNGRKVK